MSWLEYTLAMPILWFAHWGLLCAIFLRKNDRSVALAMPLSILGPVGALIAAGRRGIPLNSPDIPSLQTRPVLDDDDLPV